MSAFLCLEDQRFGPEVNKPSIVAVTSFPSLPSAWWFTIVKCFPGGNLFHKHRAFLILHEIDNVKPMR